MFYGPGLTAQLLSIIPAKRVWTPSSILRFLSIATYRVI